MEASQLQNLSFKELKEIALGMEIKIPKYKDELISHMIECFKKWENYIDR